MPRAMAERVAVVTDSTHYLPDDLAQRLGLHQVSLYVNWGGRTDRETDLPDFDDYYEHLRSATDLPTTSQPSVGDFLEVFQPLVTAGRDVLCILLSGGISGTVNSAEQAREQLVEGGADPDRIAIFDAKTAAGAHGLVVLAAARHANADHGVTECLEAAKAVRQEIKAWFAVDTLEYLKRGGRIGGAQAWLGAALRIKPILTIEAEIVPIERVRTSGRAFERLVEFLESRKQDGCDAWVVQHVQDPDRAQEMVERGRQIFGTEPEFVSEIGPVLGTHTGPGLLGVAGAPARLLGPA